MKIPSKKEEIDEDELWALEFEKQMKSELKQEN
jgi:hypothetical protein